MNTDPLASIRCWGIGVELGGIEYDIPALPAAAWWPLLAEMDPSLMLDMIDDQHLLDRLLSGEIGQEELSERLIEVVEEVAGRSMMAAVTICHLAQMHWAVVNGQLIRDGVRWDVLSLGAVLDAMHALFMERFGDTKNDKTGRLYRDEYLAMLEAPMPGAGKADHHQRQRALTDFEASAGPRPTYVLRRPELPDGASAPLERSSVARSGGTRSRTPRPSPLRRRPARSALPTEPPATPDRSDQPARSALLPDAVAPASGNTSRLRRR